MVIRIRNNDRRRCAVLSIFTRERVQVCGWKTIVYVSVAWKSCASYHVPTDFLRSATKNYDTVHQSRFPFSMTAFSFRSDLHDCSKKDAVGLLLAVGPGRDRSTSESTATKNVGISNSGG